MSQFAILTKIKRLNYAKGNMDSQTSQNEGAIYRESLWERLKENKNRIFGILVLVILAISLPVTLIAVRQSQEIRQRAQQQYKADDCFPQIQYPVANNQGWQNEDVSRYYGKSKDAQEPVVIPAGTPFYVSFNLLATPFDSPNTRTLKSNEKAIINWHNTQKASDPSSANILGLQGEAAVINYGGQRMWVSPGNKTGQTDMLTIPDLKYLEPGDYEFAFTLAGSIDGQGNVANPHCSNTNDGSGWVIRKIKITSPTAPTAAPTAAPTRAGTGNNGPDDTGHCADNGGIRHDPASGNTINPGNPCTGYHPDFNGAGSPEGGSNPRCQNYSSTYNPYFFDACPFSGSGGQLDDPNHCAAADGFRYVNGAKQSNFQCTTSSYVAAKSGDGVSGSDPTQRKCGPYSGSYNPYYYDTCTTGGGIGGTSPTPINTPTPRPTFTPTFIPTPYPSISISTTQPGPAPSCTIQFSTSSPQTFDFPITIQPLFVTDYGGGIYPGARFEVDDATGNFWQIAGNNCDFNSLGAVTWPNWNCTWSPFINRQVGTHTIRMTVKDRSGYNSNACFATFALTSPIGPSSTPTPTPTTAPFVTSTPTPPPTGIIQLGFTILLQGVGDRTGLFPEEANPNPSPVASMITRQLQIEVSNDQNVKVTQKSLTVNYDAASKRYKGTTDIGVLPAGKYNMKIKTDGYVRQLVGLRRGQIIQDLTPGAVIQIPDEILIAGDVNNDNSLNILDYYNGFAPCFNKAASGGCQNADFNADGKIDLVDHKFIVDNIKNREGH